MKKILLLLLFPICFIFCGFLTIDGDSTDWDGVPESYEYNWDNSNNCWYYGVWIDGLKFTTPKGEYDTNVRHKIQLCSDEDYIYLHIVFSRNYWAQANGDDFQFTVDDLTKSYRVTFAGGHALSNVTLPSGTYELEVRTAANSTIVSGATAELYATEKGYNYELEMRLPISEFNEDMAGEISFYSPNLMYRSVKASAAPTDFHYCFTAILFTITAVGIVYYAVSH